MNRTLTGSIVAAVAALVLLLSSYYIVHPYERALVLQFGNPVRSVNEAGIYFKMPFVQNVVYFSNKVLNFDAGGEAMPTLDQKQIIVSAFARFRIVDPLVFYQKVANEVGVQERLRPIISSNLRRALGDIPMASILTSQRAEFMQEIARQVNIEAQTFGIKVIDVRIKRVDLPEENSQAIIRRMQSQREQEARKIRAEGQKEAQTLRAEADKQAVVIVADANRQSEILRGEGDAQATGIYTAAYGRDPAFFDFYRSMQALTTALSGETTTYVGPPDGDFFRYFLNHSDVSLPGTAKGTGTTAPSATTTP
jgi:modulator of FtsH protease HflC